MAGVAHINYAAARARLRARDQLVVKRATHDPWWMRLGILTLTMGFLTIFFVMPLLLIFQEALRKGVTGYVAAFADKATLHAIWLTLVVALIAVPLNTIFGLAAAWAVAQFQFRGKRLLGVLVELPLWVSPVLAGRAMLSMASCDQQVGRRVAVLPTTPQLSGKAMLCGASIATPLM